MPRGERAPDQTQITVSLPKTLLAEIDEMRTEDNRSRSNFIVTELQRIVAQKKARKTLETGATRSPSMPLSAVPEDPTARVAEDSPKPSRKPPRGSKR